MPDDPSKAGPNWVRDRFGVDMNRFVWSGAAPIQGGPGGQVSFVQLTLSGTYNNFNPTTNAVSFPETPALICTCTTDVTITGMVPGVGGEIKTIINKGPGNISIPNQNAGSLAENQFFCGSTCTIVPGNAAQFWYDPVALEWQLLSLRGGVLSGIPFFANGGGLGLPSGVMGWVEIPADCVITGWKLESTEVSTLTIDLWNSAFANWPLSGANSIVGGNFPALAGARSNSSTVLTGWTTSLSAGSMLVCNISSTNGAAIKLGFQLDVVRTQ